MSQDQNTQNSPFVVSIHNDRLCTEKKCEPFFIREWETMIIGALICGTLLYLMCCCASENFSEYVYDRRSSTQAHFAIDDRIGHSEPNIITSDQPLNVKINEHFDTKGAILSGKMLISRGPSVSKFVDFATVDAIDHLAKDEPNPTHQPETTDDTLEKSIRQFVE